MFFDDSFIGYKARIEYSLFSSRDFSEVSDFIQSFRIPMSSSELRMHTVHPDHYKYAFIARMKRSIVGIILFTDLEDELFINHLYVAPIHRFKGIGSGLMNELKAFSAFAKITYIDTSNNYMPWMDALDNSDKSKQMYRLGSFY